MYYQGTTRFRTSYRFNAIDEYIAWEASLKKVFKTSTVSSIGISALMDNHYVLNVALPKMVKYFQLPNNPNSGGWRFSIAAPPISHSTIVNRQRNGCRRR